MAPDTTLCRLGRHAHRLPRQSRRTIRRRGNPSSETKHTDHLLLHPGTRRLKHGFHLANLGATARKRHHQPRPHWGFFQSQGRRLEDASPRRPEAQVREQGRRPGPGARPRSPSPPLSTVHRPATDDSGCDIQGGTCPSDDRGVARCGAGLQQLRWPQALGLGDWAWVARPRSTEPSEKGLALRPLPLQRVCASTLRCKG